MKKILMVLTSHRLDCFKLCMDMLLHGGSIRRFDKVVLLLNGVGSAIGPAVAGVAMTRYGAGALPAFYATTLVLAALVAGGRRLLRHRDNSHPSVFHAMLRTTPTAIGGE